MRFIFQKNSSWPPLAWHAKFEPTAFVIMVTHGPRVETTDDWFCEGVWDGRFEEGAFSDSENFFGSGGTIEEGELKFVGSCAPVDRLHFVRVRDHWHISNSLPCLLAQIQANIRATYQSFSEEVFSVVYGTDKYHQSLETTQGSVQMSICKDIVWRDSSLAKLEKSFDKRSFPTFEAYESFLIASLSNIASNMMSPLRRHPYFQFISGISTGYDSPTVCTLARKAGLTEAFTFTKARGGLRDDDGTAIGERLGIRVHRVDRYTWKEKALPEVPFMAAVGSFSGLELAGVEHFLRDRVYLTGTIGDLIWNIGTSVEQASHYKREDNTGLEMTEFRLRVGYVHIPVPCIGYAGLEDIIRINQCDEMKPWDHSNTPYENYSRPICRRIVEGAGVPRTSFAFEKRAATYDTNYDVETNITATSLKKMHEFNRSHESEWKLAGVSKVVPTWIDRAHFSVIAIASAALIWLGKKHFKGSSRIRTLGIKVRSRRNYEISFNRGFAWAIHEAKKTYLAPDGVASGS
jgi:hypothetical protein